MPPLIPLALPPAPRKFRSPSLSVAVETAHTVGLGSNKHTNEDALGADTTLWGCLGRFVWQIFLLEGLTSGL